MKLSLSGTVFVYPMSGQKQFWDKLKSMPLWKLTEFKNN